MEDKTNKFFDKALGDFAFDVACGAAIRHLNELGYTPEQIAERLDYPISAERVKTYVEKLAVSGESGEGDEGYEIVREYDGYGRSCFVRVKKE